MRTRARAWSGRMWWSVLVLCLGLVLLTTNGLHFLIAWELFTVAAYFLVTLDRQRSEVRAPDGSISRVRMWRGFVCSHFSPASQPAPEAGNCPRCGSRSELAPLFWLALAGFGLKAGMFPLHVWLPSAHANAPSHVSAILSGVTIKIGHLRVWFASLAGFRCRPRSGVGGGSTWA